MTLAKALIVYFSQGGANARVGEAIAHGLRDAGYDVSPWNLRNGYPPDPRNYQLFGIGSPVYYYNVPLNVARYVERLPQLDGIDGFVFIVHGTRRLDAANWLRRTLARKGLRELGYFHCLGEAHVLPLLREGYLFSPDHPTESELLEAEQFGASVAERVAGKPYTRPPYESPRPAIYRFEKCLANRWLMTHFYSRLFRVDASKCVGCGICMEACPTSNITSDAHRRPRWDRRCLECLSCQMKCPEEAITSALDRPFPGALIRQIFRYNVRRWVREGDLDYVRVTHRRGETHRIGATHTSEC
jgi:ferredoxin/flavodoxin